MSHPEQQLGKQLGVISKLEILKTNSVTDFKINCNKIRDRTFGHFRHRMEKLVVPGQIFSPKRINPDGIDCICSSIKQTGAGLAPVFGPTICVGGNTKDWCLVSSSTS
ncbi:hypothetical protein ATANTOWER_005366 [Ataeniobius toweri]|uniref:Uncharacterized protein n=1 Tax=Ataeniobius toweri TaxID=208326 RepID=A0ABU7ANB6_9TELE|nr:hypothetical protein [Ataeniobius toweri]